MNEILDPEGVETRAIHNLIDFAGKDVLEVGCGEGRMTARFAGVTASVLAFDPHEPSIAVARRETPDTLGGKVNFQAAGMVDIALAESTYDVAILSWSL